ncbi:unnamed protein product [Toxocara canis]|uniref:Btz domain-containing protein n=1 Tax=Toxocara canis TaxID=6265 RepID=A0A183U664_TOXCA|nr:unnamed protein product [Toxocara canis]
MTRKRKPVDSVQQTGTSVSVFSHHADVKYDRAYLNSSAGYGSVKNRDDYGNYWKDDRNSSERYSWKRHKKEFPNANQRSESEDFKKNFERRYGYVSEREPEVYQTNERFVACL